MKEVFILRGIPGAGKSTLAKSLAGKNGIICEADDYMTLDGEYNFDPFKLPEAHQNCFRKFKRACDLGCQRIIQANTNTEDWEFEKYIDYARKKSYIVHTMIIENRHESSSIHDIPDSSRIVMKERLEKHIKLI